MHDFVHVARAYEGRRAIFTRGVGRPSPRHRECEAASLASGVAEFMPRGKDVPHRSLDRARRRQEANLDASFSGVGKRLPRTANGREVSREWIEGDTTHPRVEGRTHDPNSRVNGEREFFRSNPPLGGPGYAGRKKIGEPRTAYGAVETIAGSGTHTAPQRPEVLLAHRA